MSQLTSLQEDLLRAFFERRADFFLTGGAALAGYYLHHRSTNDLDLFTTTASLDDGVEALRSASEALGASIEPVRTSPDFRRFVVTRGNEGAVVDLGDDARPPGGVSVPELREFLSGLISRLTRIAYLA